MRYKSIKSNSGGGAPQFKGEQPLTESRKGTAHSCPKRTGPGPKPSQMNMNPKGS